MTQLPGDELMKGPQAGKSQKAVNRALQKPLGLSSPGSRVGLESFNIQEQLE